MKLTLAVPDELYEAYTAYATATRPVERVILECLQRYSHIKPSDRWIMISPTERVALEEALGGRPLNNGAQITEKVIQFSSVKIGKIHVPLTAAQLREIKRRSAKNGRPAREEVEWIIKQIAAEFLRSV